MIAVLDKHTIDRIAAGEVIERPASIVKELMENAIDAGAGSVTVEIKDGGLSMIRVTDNGSGIEREYVKTAFLRHATSKISSASDLLSIGTLGFRGEALSSIAAVGRVELITKRKSELTGVRYIIEGGEERAYEEVGAPEGTTIIVRDVFFNTPARRKFLKTANTEGAHIAELVQKLALSSPDTAIRLISNNQTKLQTAGNGRLKDIIYQIYGRDTASALLELKYDSVGISVEGLIAKPHISRSNRATELFFINGRYVKSNAVSKAVEDGYGNRLMQHQYPFVCLNISVEPDELDVNVHPGKLEVRFSRADEVFRTVRDGIISVLSPGEHIREFTLDEGKRAEVLKESKSSYRPPEPFEKRYFEAGFAKDERSFTGNEETGNKSGIQHKASGYEYSAPDKENMERQASNLSESRERNGGDKQPEPVQLKFLDEVSRPMHRLVGQVFATYWIAEFDGRMYIIDQHAAHEKVLYERYMKLISESEMTSQQLVPPLIITLTDTEAAALAERGGILSDMGFEIEQFGGREFKLSAVPGILPSVNKAELFREIAEGLAEPDFAKSPEIIISKVASMACKAAVKGNNALSFMEADKLIEELLTLENPYSCPHGRPTIIEMSKTELEKKFKRIV